MHKNTALLVIDVQVGQIEAPRSAYRGGEVLAHIGKLLERARASSTTDVIYVQHDGDEGSPLAVGSEGWRIHPSIAPADGETVIHKRASDSFYQTPLRSLLEAGGVGHLVVVGCRTEYCIDTTCRQAVSLGYDVTLVRDAHTTTDGDSLTAAQIIAHHNSTLDDFGNDQHVVALKATNDIEFG